MPESEIECLVIKKISIFHSPNIGNNKQQNYTIIVDLVERPTVLDKKRRKL